MDSFSIEKNPVARFGWNEGDRQLANPGEGMASTINFEHEQAERSLEESLHHYKRVGELLEVQKAQVPHGEWTDWVEANCRFSVRHASNYMRLAREWEVLMANRKCITDLSLGGALGVIREASNPLPSPLPPEGDGEPSPQPSPDLGEEAEQPSPQPSPLGEGAVPGEPLLGVAEAADRYWALKNKRGKSLEEKEWIRRYEKSSEGKAVKQALSHKPSKRLDNPDSHSEHYTPMEYIERVIRVFGEIDLDPSSDVGRRVPARLHYTRSEDGTSLPWSGRVFVNPPYSDPDFSLLKWAQHFEAQWKENQGLAAVLWLVPAYSSEGFFQKIQEYAILTCWHRGRIKFENNGGSPARFSSAWILCVRDSWDGMVLEDRFGREFRELGLLMRGVDPSLYDDDVLPKEG